MSTPTLPIKDIIIGERFRKDLGNLKDLETSIQAIGLLHRARADRLREGDLQKTGSVKTGGRELMSYPKYTTELENYSRRAY